MLGPDSLLDHGPVGLYLLPDMTRLQSSALSAHEDSEICLLDCMTLTPRGIPGVSPARMRLVSS